MKTELNNFIKMEFIPFNIESSSFVLLGIEFIQ